MGESSNQDKDEKSSSSNQLPNINPEELARKIRELQIGSASSARDLAEAQSRKYQFWSTQPVPQFNKTEAEEAITENEYIEAPIEIDRIRKQPYSLPGDNFMWSDVDLNDEAELLELYSLLSDNYVEDDECMFRFDYSKDFLKWALMPPGWRKDWHCGLRVAKSKKLVAFIGAIPCNMQVRDKSVEMVEINFLCVHKQLRSKRVTPVLVKEITRRVNLTGIFQAAFTAGVVLPKPITTSRYWHRSLNPKKLIECGFSSLGHKMTQKMTIKLYSLPKEPGHRVVPLGAEHMETAHKLLTTYLKKFHLYPNLTLDEFKHYFEPRDKIIYVYIILNDKNEATDFISFYSLPSTVVNNPKHKRIEAAYSYYNVATSITINQLIKDALILACNAGFDVFNALDLMENKAFLEDMKFGIGDGNLQYYLYNWKTPEMKPEEVGLVLQ